MCDFFDWDRDDPERVEAHDGFKTALVQQFNSLYGTEVDDIESWRGLSLALDISPLPENLKEAKEVSLRLDFFASITRDSRWGKKLILECLKTDFQWEVHQPCRPS